MVTGPGNENPFLLREIRRLSRTYPDAPFLPARGALLLTAVLLFVGLLRLTSRSPSAPSVDALLSLVWCHAAMCFLAGVYGGDHLFAWEERHSTLAELRLLPFAARQWLALKLAFPLYFLLLLWSAGIPLYVTLAIPGRVPTSDIVALALIPLLVGIAPLAAFLLARPGTRQQTEGSDDPFGGPPGVTGADPRLRMALGVSALLLLGLTWQGHLTPWSGSRSLYGAQLPAWLLGLGAGGTFLTACFITAMATVRDEGDAEQWAFNVRLGALTIIWATGCGLLWPALPTAARWGVPAALLLLLRLLCRMRGRRRADPLAPREVAWFATRSDNPLFVHDIRRYTRFASLRRSIAGDFVGSVLLAGALGYLATSLRAGVVPWLPTASPRGLLNAVLWLLALATIRVILAPWSRSGGLWAKETDGGTLSMLLATRLRSDELLRGRLAAALIYGWGARAPFLLLVLAALGWASTHGHVYAAPVALGVGSALPALSMSGGNSVTQRGRGGGTMVVLLIAWWLALYIARKLAGGGFAPPPSVAWGLAMALLAVHLAVARSEFSAWIEALDTLRHAEAETAEQQPEHREAQEA